MRRRSLPQVVIPVPCPVDWNTMTLIDRAGRRRFCDRCERPVDDSQAMRRTELADLIAWHEGRRLPCVRLHRRPDGTIVTYLHQFEKEQKERTKTQTVRAAQRREERAQAMSNQTFILGRNRTVSCGCLDVIGRDAAFR